MEQPGGFGKMISSATSPPLVPVAPGGLVGRGLGVLDNINIYKSKIVYTQRLEPYY